MWRDIVKQFAPTLGAALGGPMGGIATKFLANKLLGNENATEEELNTYLTGATPQDLQKLKEADNQYEIEVLKLRVEDRKSARDMYTAAKNKFPQIILSAVYTIGYFWIVYGLLAGDLKIPADGRDLIIGLLAILTGAQTQILNFWFGSSSGSKDKNK